ncbi:hypothetical protein ACN47E_002616 [Coniothyrium glycines]
MSVKLSAYEPREEAEADLRIIMRLWLRIEHNSQNSSRISVAHKAQVAAQERNRQQADVWCLGTRCRLIGSALSMTDTICSHDNNKDGAAAFETVNGRLEHAVKVGMAMERKF